MAVRNTLKDLQNHLFEQLERLNDEDLSDAELAKEITRSHAMGGLATQIVNNANVMLRAMQYNHENGIKKNSTIKLLVNSDE